MLAAHAFINVIFIFLLEINSVNGDCSTIIDGYLPDPNDCSSYIQCGHGISHTMPCPAGLHWNWRINTCDWPANAGCVIADISYVSPHYGSLNGETRLTIVGSGFSVNQYDAGNQVKLVSSYREYDCPVLKDGTTETRIICYTPQNMVGDTYYIRVSVDGEAVLTNRHCGYSTDYRCAFTPSMWYTPTITSLEPQSQSGLPGGILHLNGKIFTGVYGSNVFPEEIKNGVTERMLRVYAAGQLCELKAENDTFYGFELNNGGYSTYGYIKCLMKGTFVGNFNASFIIEGHYGRSLPQKEVIRVSRNDDIYMYQTYAVINDVSPSSGSTEGRTRLSITGQYFDETEKPVRVVVGGADCKVTEKVTDGLIVCETDQQVTAPRYSGNRGLIYERYSNHYYSLNDLTKILDLTIDDNTTTTKVIDHFYFSDSNIGGDHVTRIHGFYVPPHSGRWTFHLQCYSLGKLYLSTDQNPANKVELASSSSSYGFSMSDVIELEKDKHYYIEVLQSGTGSSTIKVKALHLDTKFNDRMTGNADQEKQRISVTSSVEREIQSVEVQVTSTGAEVYEQQQVTIVEDAGVLSDAKFQLGFYGVFTEPFNVITEGEVMAYALSSLPFLDSKESVTITTSQLMDGPPGIVIDITMVSERGDFPDISVKVINGTAGETLSTTVTELVKGVPSGKYYVLYLASKPSPLLPVEANAGQVKTALDLMFGTRCPSFLKDPPADKIFFDHEAKSQSGVYITMEIEPFCGQYVGKNPSSLYAVTDSSSKGLRMTSKVNVLCFAYLGNQLKNGIGITYSYEDFNGTLHNATNSIPLTFERKSGWHYVCVEIFSAVKGFQPQGSSFYIQRIYVTKNDYTWNFYIDDIFIGLEQPTENVEVVNSYRMLPVSLGSTRIDRVDVRSTGQGLLEVTFVPYLCGHKIPLLTVEPGQVGSGVQIDIKRLQAASPPISGTFSITFKNKTKSGIPHDTSSAALTDILESIDGIGAISVYRYGSCSNFDYHITFTTLAGDQPQIQVNSSLAGRKVVAQVSTLTNGGLWYNPIPGDMLYTDHSKPQVLAYVNDVPTLCTADCSYEWLTESTPTVTAINPVTGASGTAVQITGTKLGSVNSTVTIGGVPCVITAATTTSITCNVGEGSYGTYEVEVIDGVKGKAQHDGGTLTFTYSMAISEISPTSGTIGGGITLTLSGYGFSPSAEVTIGSKACEVTSTGPVEIDCIIPEHSAGNVDVKVSVDGHEESCPTKFAYLPEAPTIGVISPTIFEVLGGGILTISVSNFASNGTLKIGSTDVPIATINDTHITAVMPSLPPGTYEVLVFNESNGAGVYSDGSRPTIQYQLSITNVFPKHGSMYGGTRLTLTGQGFSAETPKDKITVSIGNHNCGVELVSSSRIVCLIDETAAVVKIDNQGVHPHWGIGYQWNPLTAYGEAGDIFEWTWTSQPWILTFTHRIEQTKSESSIDRATDGFISSTKGTFNGMYRYQVTTPGEYQYWSGYTDYYEIVYYRGTLMVKDKQPFVGNVSVKIGGHEADYNTNSGTLDPVDTSNCPGLSSLTCQDLPDLSSSSIFQFSFDMCHSPTITSLGRDNATAVDTVTIFGSGFSTTSCNNEVTFGDANCIVKKATESSIECMIDSSNSPMIAVRQDVAVRVSNLGFALLAVEGQTARTLVVLPVVTSISPEMVSTNGGAVVIIIGAGFQGNASDITVIINGYDCPVQYVSYTEINCVAPPSGFGTKSLVVKIGVNDMTIPAVCDIECQLVYESAISPEISGITPTSLNGDVTTLTITGSGFSTVVSNAVVYVGDVPCFVEAVKDSQITCTITHAPVGDLAVDVVINNRGRATKSKTFFVTSQAVISNISPTEGSIYGGTEIVVTGNGFINEKTVVSIDGLPCDIKETNLSRIVCVTSSGSEGNASVAVVSNSMAYVEWIFEYSSAVTPIISDLSPVKGTKGTSLVITGSKFGSVDGENRVTVGSAPCEITFYNMTMIECTISEGYIGTATVLVIVEGLGVSNSDVQFEFEFAVTGIQKNSGSVSGGQTITVIGSGFDNTTNVTICGQTCTADDKANQSASQFICVTPPAADLVTVTKLCDVITTVDGVKKTMSGGYTYSQALTPDITSVSPARGGTGGGVLLTVGGTGFGTDKSVVVVKIAGTHCNVTSITDTEIVCITGQHSPSQKTNVWVEINGNGMATQTNAEFYYIDVWSSPYTWGGLDPPEDGTLVVIPAGNIILLDITTARLKMILIKGGELVFDEKDIELFADNILIVEGGRLQIGTESEPFQHKAYITGTAHLRTKELPIYGTNSLGIREGVLDLHGKPVPVVWTHLASTADALSDSITLEKEVIWQAGDEIIIATTGGPSSQRQSEKHTIKAVSADSKTLTLEKPLVYKHLGESETIGSHTFEYRAEVGLLTRNIVLRGERDRQWTEIIPACPRGFSTGEFATQTCFQGRFGEEIGSDEFGLQVMFHPPEPNKNLTIGRVSYVEFTYVGQAFRLGRYPFHLHLAGDMSSTYIKGCSIHESFNRGVNIHGSHNALVENNVIYNTKGGTVFLEDGIETGNKLLSNLVIFVRESSSLVNDDITPAAIWVTHPNNFVEHNTVVGGSHFGIWYRMHTHPDGPSSTNSICPQKEKLGSFSHNTAHSFGWYGFWIFTTYTPRTGGSCGSGTPQPTVFDNFYAWNNRKGAESVKAGALQFHNFTLVGNSEAGYEEITHLEGEWYSQNGALFKNGVIVGNSPILGGCTVSGISLPDNFGFMVDGTEFINFNGGCTALSVKHPTDHNAPAGFHYCTQNLKFTNVGPTNGASIAEFEASFMDIDGTARTNIPGSIIAQTTDMHPPNCTDFEFFSAGVPMSLCTVNVLRLSFNNLRRGGEYRGPIRFENQYGNRTINWERMYVTHPLGYMIMISTREEYTMHFDNTKLNTNVSFSGTLTLFNADDWLIFTIELGGTPDCVYVFDRVCRKNGTETPLDPEEHLNGDWYYDKSTGAVSFLVSRKGRGASAGAYYNLNFQCFKCYFKDCIVPPKPETVAPVDTTLGGVDDAMTWWGLGLKRWSDPTIWPNNTIPQEGEDVAIECGTWVLADIEIPPLGELFICGVLEFDNANYTEGYKNFTVNVTRIIIYGGRLIVGWEKNPFMGDFLITLRGNASDETYELPQGGDNIGSKVIGVYGGLDLHGKSIDVPWTTLNTTAYPDDSTIKLNIVVDWEVGQEIVVTPTGYSAWETETFQITNVEESDGMTVLTLNDTIQYRHLAYNENGVDITAEVGLLTRNVKVQSEDYPDLYEEKYGARLIVGQSEFSKGYARISNTEFYHMGQDGKNYRKAYDPRFAVSFVDSGPVNYIRPSYIRSCAFHNGFSPAIGIFNALYLPIEDNVIHGSHFYAIITDSYGTIIRRNVVTLTQNLEADLLGAISAAGATDLVLENNHVSGSERAAYDISQPCNASSSEWYSGNIGRSSLYGLITTQAQYCNRICGFILVKCGYYGVYYSGGVSAVFENLVLADNPISISITITGPSATSHQYADNTAIVNNSVIVGTSPVFDCTIDRVNKSEKGIEPLLKKGPFGQRIGIPFATFSSGSKSPMAIQGLLTIQNVEFRNFTTACSSRDNAITTNPSNDDGAHPVETSNIKFQNVERKHKIYFHRPNLGLINPADCVDMDCDGLKKGFLKDLDGTFLGTPGTPGTILPESEWQWGGDPQRGLGDYRVPKTMLTMLNGTRIPMSTLAPMKGIIREDDCVFESDWNAYVCREFDYEMMVIESMDSDSTSRRLSPVALLGHNSDGDGVIDLMNGPQDHGWCSGYACKSRLSTFQAIVATGKNYELYFTSTSPQSSRYFLLNADDSQAVRIAVWYSQPYRMDVYYQEKLVLPVNGRFGIDNAYILSPPPVGEPFAYHPNATKDPAATNWFDRDSGLLYFVLRGSDPINIVTTKQIIVSFMYPAMTANDFYGERIVELLAAFFDLPPSKVRVVNIVSAQQNKRRRRRRSTERDQIVVEIGDVPNNDFNTTADDAIADDQLQQIYAKIVTEGEVGNISQVVNATVLGLGVAEPTLDPSDPKWARVTTEDKYRILIQVDHLDFETTTLPQYEGTIFPRQPKICAYDIVGVKITDLGTDLYPWNITATLRQGTGNPDGVLSGNTTVPFINGEANFTNLEISHPGIGYILDFNMTEPVEAENLTLASMPLDVQKIPVTAVIISATEDVYTTESMTIEMELREELTGNKLDNIAWRSHEWNVEAEMGSPEYYNGSLHGSNQKFWGSSSQATFSDLIFTSFGMAIINFRVTTNPPEYNFTIPHYVNVKQLQHKNIIHNETNEIVLKIDGDYNTVVGSDDRYAKAMFGNWFAVLYEDLQINSVTLQPGSILVTLNVSGSHDSINSTLYSTCSMLTDGQTINYNGQALELSKYMYYNGSVFYGEACEVTPDDEGSEVPMALIVGSVVGGVLLIVIIMIVWRMKSQSKNKVQVAGGLLGCGCGTGSHEKDTDEILYREKSFMSVPSSTPTKGLASRDQSFLSNAPSAHDFKAPRLSQAWNSNF